VEEKKAEEKKLKPCRKCGKAPDLCGYTEKRIKISDWICVDCIRLRTEAVAAVKAKRKGGAAVEAAQARIKDTVEASHGITSAVDAHALGERILAQDETADELARGVVVAGEAETLADQDDRDVEDREVAPLPADEEFPVDLPEPEHSFPVEPTANALRKRAARKEAGAAAVNERRRATRDVESEKARHKAYRARKKAESTKS
jgi:hypothetical protein